MKRIKKVSILIIFLVVISYLIYYYQISIKNKLEIFATWAYPENKNRNGEIIKLILNILAGIVILIGLYASIIRARATQKSVEKQEKSISNQSHQIELTRKSQTNEQFKNAVEHLGSEKEPIILGGISELNQIASEDSKKYSKVVFNIFCSYIRTEANIKKRADDINFTIVQTIIDYILRSDIYLNFAVNLNHCNLTSVNMDNVKLVNANMSFSYLPLNISNIEFINSNLSRTTLNGRYTDVYIKDCEIFKLFSYNSEFKNLRIDNLEKKSQKLVFIDSKFNNSFFSFDSYDEDFLACEFNNCKFYGESFLNSKFYSSSFLDCEFSNIEVSGCNFAACGFYMSKMTTNIFNSNFNGVDNEYKYFMLFMEKRLLKRKNKEVDLSGLEIIPPKVLKCTFEPLESTESNILLEEYKKIKKEYTSYNRPKTNTVVNKQ
ncbi:hypothetical protein [Tenacibaculum sp.]|uniref:pentapeptide repeat-containing protein n=1 Tax=Tenacibaculum sp. TaxID=1906242 RepID=UPI003AA8F3F5